MSDSKRDDLPIDEDEDDVPDLVQVRANVRANDGYEYVREYGPQSLGGPPALCHRVNFQGPPPLGRMKKAGK